MATRVAISPTELSNAEMTSYAPGLGLPLFVQPTTRDLAEDRETFHSWFRDSEDAIDALLHEHGALVFRGFPVHGTADFDATIGHYATPSFGYNAGSTPRGKLGAKVFEATSTPPNVRIALHQEMAYLPTYPERLAFFCRMPSVTAGETLLGDMRRLTAELDKGFVREVEARGVLYTRNMRDRGTSTGSPYFDAIHRTWQDAFSTDDPNKPIADAARMGLGAEWLDDGSLSVTYHGPGMVDHPRTGERLWFNQLATQNLGVHNTAGYDTYVRQYGDTGRYPFMAAFGDGEPLSAEQAQILADASDRCAVAFPWSSGDVMLIDNYRCAHGRSTFTGRRDVQVALLN